jgi:hypothetical protein
MVNLEQRILSLVWILIRRLQVMKGPVNVDAQILNGAAFEAKESVAGFQAWLVEIEEVALALLAVNIDAWSKEKGTSDRRPTQHPMVWILVTHLSFAYTFTGGVSLLNSSSPQYISKSSSSMLCPPSFFDRLFVIFIV